MSTDTDPRLDANELVRLSVGQLVAKVLGLRLDLADDAETIAALHVDLAQRDAALAVLRQELADVRALALSWRRLGAVLCGYDVHGEGCDRPATKTRSVTLSDTEAMVWWRCDAHEAGGEGWRELPHAAAIRALTT